MPRWICPDCDAVMKVAPGLIGQFKPCASCQTVSQVFDADAPPAFPVTAPQPIQTHGLPVPVSTIHRIKGETPLYVTLMRVGAVAQFLGVCLGCIFLYSLLGQIKFETDLYRKLVFLPIAPSLLLLGYLWIWTDFISDVYRCRRLLEEIAKK